MTRKALWYKTRCWTSQDRGPEREITQSLRNIAKHILSLMLSRPLEPFHLALCTSQKALPPIRNSQDFPEEIIPTENGLLTKSRLYKRKFLISPSRKSEVQCPAVSSSRAHWFHLFIGKEKGKLTRHLRPMMKRLGNNNKRNNTCVTALTLESSWTLSSRNSFWFWLYVQKHNQNI